MFFFKITSNLNFSFIFFIKKQETIFFFLISASPVKKSMNKRHNGNFSERTRSTKEIIEELFAPPKNQKIKSFGYTIFCIPISKAWTFKTQIIVSIIILNLFSFMLIGLVLGVFNINFYCFLVLLKKYGYR